MEFPFFSKAVRVALRRKETFFSAFSIYAIFTVVISVAWFGMEESGYFYSNRADAARVLFNTTLYFAGLVFVFQSALSASGILVLEREKKCARLLHVAPVRPARLVAEKAAVPLAIMGLFFTGFLPVLSLMFLLGGVAIGEFAYQFANLLCWVSTGIFIGLWASSRAITSVKSRGRTIGLLIFLLFLLPVVPVFFTSMLSVMDDNFWRAYPVAKMYLKAFLEWGAWATTPIQLMNPGWMYSSYYLSPALLTQDAGLLRYFQACPAAAAWLLHLGLQALLFLGAVRGWRRLSEDREKIQPPERVHDAQSLTRKIFYGRAKRTPYPPGGWVFFSQQDRDMFKRGWFSKSLFAILYILAFGVVYYLIRLSYRDDMSQFDPRESAYVVPLVSIPVALLFALGISSSAMRRDKDRGTGILILPCPLPARAVFFGRWLYFQIFALTMLFIGWGITVAWVYQWPRFFQNDSLKEWSLVFGIALATVPLLTVAGMSAGLRARSRISTWMFVVPFLILCFGLGFIQMLQELATSGGLESLAEFLETMVTRIIPVLGYGAGVSLALTHPSLEPFKERRSEVARIFLAVVWGTLAFLEIVGWVGEDWIFWVGGESWKMGDVVFWSRIFFLPSLGSFLYWSYIASRKNIWWEKKLIGKELGA
jgi:ABC-type transport system involved in multi-copper enzyme maturation permease subunit